MLKTVWYRSALTAALLAGSSLAVMGCEDEPVPEPEPEVATMRITIGAQTVNVTNGTVTGGPIVISANTNFTVTWLLANGQPEPLVTAADFEVEVVPANTAVVTFTRTGAFAGTLNRLAAGSTTISFGLLHVAEQHHDFGPFDVPITVN